MAAGAGVQAGVEKGGERGSKGGVERGSKGGVESDEEPADEFQGKVMSLSRALGGGDSEEEEDEPIVIPKVS